MSTLIMNNIIPVIIFSFVFIVGILYIGTRKKKGITATDNAIVTTKPLLSVSESLFFQAIKNAVPDHNVMVKVHLGSILKCSDQGVRNKYNRQPIMFVVTDSSLNIIALIDVKTGKSKTDKTAELHSIISRAGYKLLSYNEMPKLSVLRADITS